MGSANEKLEHHIGTSQWYKYLAGILLTDGAKELAEKFRCFWFLDIVCSFQVTEEGFNNKDFQCWRLVKHPDQSATITVDDGNKNILKERGIEWTDFPEDEATVWYQRGVILLPSEY